MVGQVTRNQLETLKQYVEESKIMVFYGGAGTSTESGIADYRSQHGKWTAMEKDGYDPLKYANPRFIAKHPEIYFKKIRDKEEKDPEPNATHKILAQWEQDKKDVRVITQNVDGLHQQAGHRHVLELHGHHRVWHCMTCGREYLVNELKRDEDNVPRCYVCEGIVRPNVVYFGENVSKDTLAKARQTLKEADLLVVAGTSLTTPLAKRLVQDFQGDRVVVINLDELDLSPLKVDLFIQDWVGKVMEGLAKLMEGEER